jgi:hydroxymethylbilane synthase
MKIRLGTRGSALARWQAEWVATQLGRLGHEVELILIKTEGDQKGAPIATLGATGLFTKELQHALLDNRIDVAVHSLKDLPTDPIEGLQLAAVPVREEVQDALVTRGGGGLESLRPGAMIGTGSTRRRAQLLHWRPDLDVRQIRGNVDTRLRKLDDEGFDAIVLACAGLVRLGWEDRITERLAIEQMLPAVGQGALGIECRADQHEIQNALQPMDHPPSHLAVLAERALLATLRGGCLAPVGAFAHFASPQLLQLQAVVLSPDGQQRLHACSDSELADLSPDSARKLGSQVAQSLIDQGARRLLESARAENS